jgi:hypothetical protein
MYAELYTLFNAIAKATDRILCLPFLLVVLTFMPHTVAAAMSHQRTSFSE